MKSLVKPLNFEGIGPVNPFSFLTPFFSSTFFPQGSWDNIFTYLSIKREFKRPARCTPSTFAQGKRPTACASTLSRVEGEGNQLRGRARLVPERLSGCRRRPAAEGKTRGWRGQTFLGSFPASGAVRGRRVHRVARPRCWVREGRPLKRFATFCGGLLGPSAFATVFCVLRSERPGSQKQGEYLGAYVQNRFFWRVGWRGFGLFGFSFLVQPHTKPRTQNLKRKKSHKQNPPEVRGSFVRAKAPAALAGSVACTAWSQRSDPSSRPTWRSGTKVWPR